MKLLSFISLFFLFGTATLQAAKCPINNFHPPVNFKNSNLDLTPQESYAGWSYIHAGLDIMGDQSVMYAVAPGILSHYRPISGNNYYFDALSLDHGNGWISVYMHIDIKTLTEDIRYKIENKIKLEAGEVIGRINDGGSLRSHVHYVLFNDKTSVIFNPLHCLDIVDRKKPIIDSIMLEDTDFVQESNRQAEFIFGLIHSLDASSNNIEREERNKIVYLENKDYLINVFAYDLIEGNKRGFHIDKLEFQFKFLRNGQEVGSFEKKQLFDASVIPCGYKCDLSNLWKGEFVHKKTTAYNQPNSKSLFFNDKNHKGHPYRLNDYQYKLDKKHFNGLDKRFNPCHFKHLNYDELQIKVKVWDRSHNKTKKTFSFYFNQNKCL